MSEEQDNRFSWVKTHQEIVEFIKTKRDNQEELIGILKGVGITGLHDEEVKGKREDLK